MGDNDTPRESGKVWTFLMSWTGRISALIGLGASLAGGFAWVVQHHRAQAERRAALARARAESEQSQYAAALATYDGILKDDPLNPAALEGEVNTAMLWVEDFTAPDSASAASSLDPIFSTLSAGLAHATGSRAADIQSHLGWAHWLNDRIAEREFGSAAEQNFRAALATDPRNVYANAMLGNWALQNGGSVPDAVQHFNIAIASGRARPFVRQLQFAGLLNRDAPGARAALIEAANTMRADGEPLDPVMQHRLLVFCCDTILNRHAQLVESLSAVPPNDAWATWLWLDNPASDHDDARIQSLRRAFIQANLAEIAGQPQQALAAYRLLRRQLAQQPGSLLDAVNASIGRLTHA
jgi:tetratricopeptide (TPR) repeat protein